ncbi:MAG: hypothetical protein Q8L60_05140 [Gammaproteobacteria bacterium]|nr:hypothetical protein [Gammaproteobacteria bacterium]MDP2140786.1 hypothetical protein [Gammaproteobacteria bacterium]MDP2347040.1 hypothetical protein [Gammaproteobacteria bacterium]
MHRLVGFLQLFMSGLLGCMALATLINMALIAMRPETISVVNAFLGQGVIIIFLAVWSRVFFVKGMERVRQRG